MNPHADDAVIDDLQMVIARKLYQRGNPRDEFLHFDTYQVGKLTAPQFAAAVASLGVRLSEHELAVLVRRFDTDRSNAIDYNEFLAIFDAQYTMRSASSLAYGGAHRQGRGLPEQSFSPQPAPPVPAAVRLRRLSEQIQSVLYRREASLTALFLDMDTTGR
jgi:hypothetical protein